MLKGIDFAFGNGLTTAQIKAAGYQFVCRYLSGGNSKDISAAELGNYKAAGIPVVFVWETTGTDMTSIGQGAADATAAQAELARLGASDAAVFFAADEQTETNLVGYMQGVNSVISVYRSGLYGGLASVKAAFDAHVVTFGWQTYAWSGGQWDNRALLRQVRNGITCGPATVDEDEAAYWGVVTPVLTAADDFGQWPRPAGPAPSGVIVPALVGVTGSAAVTRLAQLGLASKVSSSRPVVSQTPGPGAVVAPGSVVDLGV